MSGETDIWSLPSAIGSVVVAVILIAYFGVKMTLIADRLATRTGLGEAIMGALFVGASTSLSEIVTCTTAALANYADLAVSNAIGSIAGQTAFLAIADMTYRRANLEHAAAAAENLILGAFLTALLAVPLIAMALPPLSLFGVHPLSLVIVAAYVFGMRLVAKTHHMPMWHPRNTRKTRKHRRTKQRNIASSRESLTRLWGLFAVTAVFVGISGWLLARGAISIVHHTGLSETVAGGLLAGIASSIPELVAAITAVRIGALTLAIGNVLGGNAFDVLLVAVSDVAYRSGSIYEALSKSQSFLIAVTILLTGILLLGLLHRERHGVGNIGTEGVLVLTVYVGAYVLLIFVS